MDGLVQRGRLPFAIAGVDRPCETWYKVVGDLHCGKPAVIALHGGPGASHDYLLPFAQLWELCGLPVVFYDQIGAGRSTHLPEKAGDKTFFTMGLLMDELANLVKGLKLLYGYYLLGQSSGGMIAVDFATRRPPGLRKLVLASALASVASYVEGTKLLRAGLPQDFQDGLSEAERTGNWSKAKAKAGMAALGKKHVFRGGAFPADLVASLRYAGESSVYETMLGVNYLFWRGSLVAWDATPRLHLINVPTLVYNGEYDTSHDVTTQPFMDHIVGAKRLQFANAGHFCHMEPGLEDEVLKAVGDFLV